jgi:hypothetical protein
VNTLHKGGGGGGGGGGDTSAESDLINKFTKQNANG